MEMCINELNPRYMGIWAISKRSYRINSNSRLQQRASDPRYKCTPYFHYSNIIEIRGLSNANKPLISKNILIIFKQ